MDVLTAAWEAHSRPPMNGLSAAGGCARCGRADLRAVATRAVVSKAFTGYDGWLDPSGAALCPVCAWGYRTPELRSFPHLITAHPPSLRQLNPSRLGDLLAAPLRLDVAVVVPLRPGRKHLLPTAVWGRVTVDDAHLPWTTADAARLAAMRRLRGRGFGSRMLATPAPPWAVFRRLPTADHAHTINDWRMLDPWRSRRPWFDLALQATRPPAGATA